MVEVAQSILETAAVFQGSLVNLKNSPTHKSVILQVEIPEEYGEAIVRAFGWPTRVKPLSVAVARLEEKTEKPAGWRVDTPSGSYVEEARGDVADHVCNLSPEETSEAVGGVKASKPKRFGELSPAEQAGILCRDPEFVEFLMTTPPYKSMISLNDYGPDDAVRQYCCVRSRADIKEGTEAYDRWSTILDRYRRWQADRDRTDVDL